MADFAIIKAALEADFPDWKVWRSDAGRWYATRAGSLRDLLGEQVQVHPGEGAG